MWTFMSLYSYVWYKSTVLTCLYTYEDRIEPQRCTRNVTLPASAVGGGRSREGSSHRAGTWAPVEQNVTSGGSGWQSRPRQRDPLTGSDPAGQQYMRATAVTYRPQYTRYLITIHSTAVVSKIYKSAVDTTHTHIVTSIGSHRRWAGGWRQVAGGALETPTVDIDGQLLGGQSRWR